MTQSNPRPSGRRLRHYRIVEKTGAEPWAIEVEQGGLELLLEPILNKGTAFTPEERQRLGLQGLLPPATSAIADQVRRIADGLRRQPTDLDKYLYLIALQDRNETLFYRFALDHLDEVLPLIYTPTVGQACQQFSHIYRRPRGLYVTLEDVDRLDTMLAESAPDDVAILVVTDGERILGTGDQGAGGMGIPIGKLSLYTLGAGIHPTLTLPVMLDVGTDNEELRTDPLYLGLRHPRVRGARYDALIEAFVAAVHRRWPHAILQWEDFAKENAFRILDRFRGRTPSFNDDILGTGAIVAAALVNALKVAEVPLVEARVLFLGAGEACIGSARAVLAAKRAAGAAEAEARRSLVLLDTRGAVSEDRPNLPPFKADFALRGEDAARWPEAPRDRILEAAIDHFRPHAIVGATGIPRTFDEKAVRAFAGQAARPILFALSNPSAMSEAQPDDLMRWTSGRAIVATGSPFPPVAGPYGPVPIAQANNMLVFPGVGLGVWVARATEVTDAMFAVAARAVAATVAPEQLAQGRILPPVQEIRSVSRAVARAVAEEAMRSGHAPKLPRDELDRRLDRETWEPRYMRLVVAGDDA